MTRNFLNGILTAIDSETLTDEEFDSVDSEIADGYTMPVYQALKTIIQNRDGVSGQLKRLKAFFISKGLDTNQPARLPHSQIFIGGALE